MTFDRSAASGSEGGGGEDAEAEAKLLALLEARNRQYAAEKARRAGRGELYRRRGGPWRGESNRRRAAGAGASLHRKLGAGRDPRLGAGGGSGWASSSSAGTHAPPSPIPSPTPPIYPPMHPRQAAAEADLGRGRRQRGAACSYDERARDAELAALLSEGGSEVGRGSGWAGEGGLAGHWGWRGRLPRRGLLTTDWPR